MIKVSFCQENNGAKELKELLNREHPEIDTSMNKCIGECGKCGWDYIARIDGKLIYADTAEELYKIILNNKDKV